MHKKTALRQGQFPWHAIVWGGRDRRQLVCGGAIISKYLVLTAAHCVEKRTRVGPINVGRVKIRMEEKKTVAYYHIEAIIEHPRRDKLLMTNDLAIIKVRVPFKFSKNVQPISIGNLSVDRLHENETVIVS